MKLAFLIAAIALFVITAVLGFTGDSLELRELLALTNIGLGALAASLLPIR